MKISVGTVFTLSLLVGGLFAGAQTQPFAFWKSKSNQLVGGKPTSACAAASGTVVTVPEGQICRFEVTGGALCPAGWVQHQNWSTAISRFINPNCGYSCTTVAVPWSNSVKPNCDCPAAGVCGPCSWVSDNPAIRQIGCK